MAPVKFYVNIFVKQLKFLNRLTKFDQTGLKACDYNIQTIVHFLKIAVLAE